MIDLANYLKSERLKAGLSQQEVAERSRSLSQKQISRIEIAPLTQDLNSVMEYLNVVAAGKTEEFLQIVSKVITNESTLNMQNNGIDMQNKQLLLQQIEIVLQKVANSGNPLIKNAHIDEGINSVRKHLLNIQTKPIIAAMGPSDAGKSTLLNFVLKNNLLPAKWQPTTCLVTLLMHKDDKPDYIHGSVAIYKVGFQPYMIFDEQDQKEFYIESGEASLLKKYASKNEEGEMYDENAYMAITFVDSPVLNSVWLLDTPGQLIDHDAIRRKLNGEATHDLIADVDKALSAVRLADGIIFASSTTKFLRDDEPNFFSSILKANPPLDATRPLENIVVLKTHSYGEIDSEANEQIFLEASINLQKEFGYLLYDSWKSDCPDLVVPTAKNWQATMLPFFKENVEYCKNFDSRLLALITYLIANRNERVEHQVLQVKNEIKKIILATKQSIENKKIESAKRTEEVDHKVARFRIEEEQLLKEFDALLSDCEEEKIDNIKSLSDSFKLLTKVDEMYDFIDSNFSDKDDAKSKIAGAISAHFENQAKSVLTKSTRNFSEKLDIIVEKWQRAIPVPSSQLDKASSEFEKVDLSNTYSNFDARSALVGGLAGLASFGAMAGYVATITSNLGAYILVGEAAGILTALGITSSVTTLPVIVAQTGGPIVWGITIAAAIGLLVFKLFADWKKSLAKSVSSGLIDSNALGSIRYSVEKYWDDSKIALRKAVERLKNETEKYIEALKIDAKTEYSRKDIDEALAQLDEVGQVIS
ncbi:dynamin family protein [Undibacterium sp. Ji49W]|uniref:dynamin family protein n=1 Tax=Undibacterium sp. Ji49W TaxID=3413040 RepID=UPI003BF1B297